MPLIEHKSDCHGFAKLDFAAQNFYWTLRTHLDMSGRQTGDPQLLLSILFPLKRNLRTTDISRWLAECQKAGVLRCYRDSKSRPVVEVPDGVQRKLSNVTSKFEPFTGGQAAFALDDPPPPMTAPKVKGIEEKRREAKTAREPVKASESSTAGAETPDAAIPTLNEVLAYAEMRMVPAPSARSFFNHHEDNDLWLNQFNRLIKWKSKLMNWSANDRQLPKATNGHQTNNNARASAPDRAAGTFNEGRTTDGMSRKVR